jgi:putative hydrolase of the HAD superfamily
MVTLLIDADDTLWENNVHFERATDGFLELITERGGSRTEARALLSEIERRNIPLHGYGTRGFTLSMMETLEEVTRRKASPEDRERILGLGHLVRNMPIEYLPDVQDTLARLREYHRLILFTKGDQQEQQDKVDRSGVVAYFHHVEITGEKKAADYVRLMERYCLECETSWMVGNSPRSDVNPALEVGLGAVYIPHPRTWMLEHEELSPRQGARLKILARFAELVDHFSPDR